MRQFDEAREQAALAVDVAAKGDHRSRAAGYELLARIALARHNIETAREEAALAREENPALPLPTYIEARQLYDQGKYADALPLFLQAIAELKKSDTLQISGLHFYAGDTLQRLKQFPEAEAELVEELKHFPQNTRARGGLAMLYQASGQPEAATDVLTEMLRVSPTPESYALAARLFKTFGNSRQAEVVRAEAQRAAKY